MNLRMMGFILVACLVLVEFAGCDQINNQQLKSVPADLNMNEAKISAECPNCFELKKEVINAFRFWVDSEKQFVFLIIAFNLLICSFILSEKVFASEKSVWIGAAVLLFLISAALYYSYYLTLHLAVRDMIFTLENLDVEKAKTLQAIPWQHRKLEVIIASLCSVAGLLILLCRYFYTVRRHAPTPPPPPPRYPDNADA